jgi:hypothetical protein
MLKEFLPWLVHFDRRAYSTQHGCLPSCLVDGDKGIKIVLSEGKKNCTEPTRAAKTEQKSLVPA